VDPDSEIVTATTVTSGNASDGSVAVDLIGDLVDSNDNDDSSSGEATDGVISDEIAPDADGGAPTV